MSSSRFVYKPGGGGGGSEDAAVSSQSRYHRLRVCHLSLSTRSSSGRTMTAAKGPSSSKPGSKSASKSSTKSSSSSTSSSSSSSSKTSTPSVQTSVATSEAHQRSRHQVVVQAASESASSVETTTSSMAFPKPKLVRDVKTKAVVRRLPPGLSEEAFVGTLVAFQPTFTYFRYFPGRFT